MQRFAGRCAIVTGGASGIGKSTALRLAHEGASVVVADLDETEARRTASEIEASGGTATVSLTNVTDPQAVASMASAARDRFGGIHILVNSVGVLRRTKARDIAVSEWEAVMAANLTSAFLCSVAVYDSMVAAKSGRIINVASMAGRATSTLGGAHYTSAKAGLLGLTRHLAREWTGQGVTVNAVSPGIVETPMVLRSTGRDELARIAAAIPSQRLADPSEVAALICFLASTEAAYITGTNVDIHGGELIIQ